jgi:Fur family zinc uptake transcriptional regulator/Fur family ferric uptake transcriptional regulator
MKNDRRSALRNLNLKATPKRLAILDILEHAPVYLSPEEVWQRMKKLFKRIGLPTVYRNLEELSEGKVISKIIHPNRQLYYFLCQNRNHHHHFICVSCRKVEDITFCKLKEVEREVRERINGKVLSHILQVNGLCEKCFDKQGPHEI